METTFYLNIRGGAKEGIIYFVFSHMNIKTRISSKIKLNKNEWSNGYPLQKNSTKALRNTLDGHKIKIDKYINETIANKQRTPTPVELQNFIHILINGVDNNKARKTVKYFIDEFVSEQKKILKAGTIRYKQIHLDHFIELVGQNITVVDLSKEVLEIYKKKLKQQGIQTATSNSHIKTILSFLNWLGKKEIIDPQLSKILKKDPEIEKPVIALTEQELIKLEAPNKLPNHLQRQLDIFLIMCYTAMDISTLRTVTKDCVIGNAIHLRREKTSQLIKIPILPEAKILLEKYDYKLPFIADNKHNVELKEVFKALDLNRMVKITKQTTNGLSEEFKPLCDTISSHKGRKTAITIALSKGIPLAIVMQLSGHKKLSTMQKYINFSDDVLSNEMQKMSRIAPI